jgi:hypothetical protein
VRRANGEDCNVRPEERVGCPLVRSGEACARKGFDDVLAKRDHFASGWETGMNNIFWIIGVVVVVLVVLGFLGLR